MKLVAALAVRSPQLRLGPLFVLALEIERYCSPDKIFQGHFIDPLAFVDIDSAPDIPLETGVEETFRVLQRSSLGKCQFDGVLVRLPSADDPAVRKDGNSRRCLLGPLPLFNDLRICRVYDFAHLGERSPAPVTQFFDPCVDYCRSRFHRNGLFHVQLHVLHPNVVALRVTPQPAQV